MSVDTYYKNRKSNITLGYEKVGQVYRDIYNILAGLAIILYIWYRFKVSFMSDNVDV